MSLLLPRDALPFPANGANTTDTIINTIHYNTSALLNWNYTLYSNSTLSNNSKCYLVYGPYKPVFLNNGTWLNGTTCYVPVLGIRQRGKLGIAFATLFAACLFFTLVCLKKHGQQFLRESKRFRPVGRRWVWYWMIFTCACGLIGTVTSVDVDRNYLTSLAVILQSFFFFLMYCGTLATVWEGVRHWGSWQERQIVDVDSFALRQDDRRSKIEFYLPLVFYLWDWLMFFMLIPRSWTPIEKQRSPAQQSSIAEPAATDNRFKAGSVIAVAAYVTIAYMLKHHLHHYKPHSPGLVSSIANFCHHCPTKLFLALVVLAIRVGYGIASAWSFDLSIMKFDGNPAWPYGLGYAPSVLIMVIFIVAGLVEENEDKVLIRQRRERGRATDAELGITRKPGWWHRKAADYASADERLRGMAGEVHTGRRREGDGGVRLQDLEPAPPPAYTPSDDAVAVSSGIPSTSIGLRDRSRSRNHDDPFRDVSPAASDTAALRPGLGDQRTSSVVTASSAESTMTGTTLNTAAAPQQRIRSMLDV